MITEDYVSFETAKLLKEKGFNFPCCRRYKGDSMITQSALYSTPFYQEEKSSGYVLCPTLQMAMKWLREVYNIIIVVEPYMYHYSDSKTLSYLYSIWYGDNYDCKNKEYNSYEEAVEVAIKYCLENLI